MLLRGVYSVFWGVAVVVGLLVLVGGSLCADEISDAQTSSAQRPNLAKEFVSPPMSSKPQVWWHWMNGNITKEGLTADLEAMKQAGVGGATIVIVDCEIPAGPVKFMSPEFRAMFKHAVTEAHRLGLFLSIENCAGWSSSGGKWNTPEHAMQIVVTTETNVTGPSKFSDLLPQPATQWGFYRDIAVYAMKRPSGKEARINNISGKAAFVRSDGINPDTSATIPASGVFRSEDIIDLTSKLGVDGRLEWDVPAGEWTILRMGHTPTGTNNHPAPIEGTGPEVDKLSKEAMDLHFAGMMQKLLDDIGPLAGKGLMDSLIDSYEVGSQNWTVKLPEEFKKRCGYDMIPYLPVYTGRVIGSAEKSERFLWDVRRVVSDMFAENYCLHFTELCHKAGLTASVEPYGDGTFEDIGYGGQADIPMGEFWSGGGADGTCKLASSIAHTYGRKYVATESFTAAPENGKWTNDPYSLKAQGDQNYCMGVNRFIFHRYAHQPWMNRFPGMTMGQWGFHFERTVTWWEQSSAWLQYLARCQYMLSQGLFVADAAYFIGESAPVSLRVGNPTLPQGYDYDGCNREVIMKRMVVKNGKIVLPDGMSYRMLILPPDETMTPELLRKIKQLVTDGATVVGQKPVRSPSLKNYPACDDEVASIANELWGKCDGKTVTEVKYGKGRIIWNKPLAQVFTSMGLKPDFESSIERVPYIHRRVAGNDVYFVVNPLKQAREAYCTFRVSGKVPELWDAETGRMKPAPVYSEKNGCITIPLSFEPTGSVFVVFKKQAVKKDHFVVVKRTEDLSKAITRALPELVIKKAIYEALDGAGSVDVTDKLTSLVKNNSIYVTASNELAGDPASMHVKRMRVEYTLDGKPATVIVPENSMLSIPDGFYRMSGERVSSVPQSEIIVKNNKPQITFWEPGSVQLKSASGAVVSAKVSDLPANVIVNGPWELRFPPNWGAPATVTLPELISWSDHPDIGVKYFSGTATYVKELNVPAAMIGKGKGIYLDLGNVKNFSQVTINGKYLGIMWKPPFRVDITDCVHAGSNHMEIRVTNLWPNRLIGDEQLPEDREWNGMQLVKWPDWVLQGKPSPTGRYTFTTWHHYTKDSQLLESGLIGPVILRPVVKVEGK